MMNYQLVALDIDGTLLNSAGQLASSTRSAVKKVQASGLKVILATGRRLVRTTPLARSLGLQTPLIVHNGAVIYDPQLETAIFQKGIPLELAFQIQKELELARMNYVVYTGPSCGDSVLAPLGLWRERENLIWRFLDEEAVFLKRICLQADPVRISVVDRAEKTAVFYNGLKSRYGSKLNIMYFGADRHAWQGIEIVAGGCSKGTGLAYAAKRLSVSADRTIAFGDDVNDLEMLAWAARGVAMANAAPALKAQADMIAPHNDLDGVASVLAQLVPEGR